MTRFSVWAPDAPTMRVRVAGTDHPMTLQDAGWWRVEVDCATHGADYSYLLGDSEDALPDPRSRWQPHGVHGPSRTYDHAAFRWTDGDWAGRELTGGVVYAMHVGAFTPEGTFDAAIDKLDHLTALGVDAVELRPVNVERGPLHYTACWYTPHPTYGGPDGLKRFVDACHARGIAVVLDLHYDHVEASSPRLGPYLADVVNTWGHTLALDGPHADGIRSFIVDNVSMWLRDYHADGIRLDAAHTLIDRQAMRLLEELTIQVETMSARLGRPLSLIAGSDRVGARLITPRSAPGDLAALWEPEDPLDRSYRAEFGTLEQLFTILRQRYSDVGGTDRPLTALSPGMLRLGATLLMTAPSTPVIQMGEEWAARPPGETGAHWPAHEARALSSLDWSELDKREHSDMFDLYRRLIAMRRAHPDLSQPMLRRSDVWHGASFLAIRRGRSVVVTNLRRTPQRVNLHGTARSVLVATEPGLALVHDSADLPGESAAVVSCARFDR
ncbi:alpha-amylase family glycosyl hydrolase [Phytohabitans aurantiacus]|uniref:Malto-oligosyltrehalose trehalohydrolase n=1 Tax=Phytohabitans aurantiacus TaxID=3016789 RepID=A0ABQ5QTG8_9ACTN|nr:alpha-amylase family glycosyl hydrolase [Phytohabitans aurantiacus]GLH97547.1 malto-oligosyltrehalose trehalohydrolase [Phytohabitans aurantiacus]